jgi:hypothetical protein
LEHYYWPDFIGNKTGLYRNVRPYSKYKMEARFQAGVNSRAGAGRLLPGSAPENMLLL